MKAWVFGASSGIGLGITEKLLLEGWDVIGFSRKPSPIPIKHYSFDLYNTGEEIAQYLNNTLMIEGLGEEDVDNIEYMLKSNYKPGWRKFWHLSKVGAPDLAVISAGYGAYMNLSQWHDDDWIDCKQSKHLGIDSMIHLNLTSKMWVCNTLLRAMRRKRKGKILIIGSRVAGNGSNGLEVYGACQSGLRGFIKSASRHPAKRGVILSLYEPGWTDTPMSQNLAPHIMKSSIDKWGQMATVKEVASNVYAFIKRMQPGEISGDKRYGILDSFPLMPNG